MGFQNLSILMVWHTKPCFLQYKINMDKPLHYIPCFFVKFSKVICDLCDIIWSLFLSDFLYIFLLKYLFFRISDDDPPPKEKQIKKKTSTRPPHKAFKRGHKGKPTNRLAKPWFLSVCCATWPPQNHENQCVFICF